MLNISITFNFRTSLYLYLGVMKVPPSLADDQLVSNLSVDNATDSDDGLNEQPPHSPSREGDFSEYLWMENEEEFEEQIMHQFEEEALMQQCIEAMQDEMNSEGPMPGGIFANRNEDPLCQGIQNLTVEDQALQVPRFIKTITTFYIELVHWILQSKLNPDAAEFVPRISNLELDCPPAKEN